MSATAFKALLPGEVADASDRRAELAEIDASCRLPVLYFVFSGLAWLLIGTGLALLASMKLHLPEFLAECPVFTFGRVRPAHLNTVVYGFASQTGIGVALWLLCRLCRVPLVAPGLIAVANIFWNIGLTLGVGGILAGDSTGIEWLEMPAYAAPILFFSYALIGVWAVITFRLRREKQLYVSQWYLLAALLWFPWIYSTAQIMLVAHPVRGVVQAAINWWFAHNLIGLWFTPIGLASIYYFLPKVIGRPIRSYQLAAFGFWSLALFSNWTGLGHLVGGPLPAWMLTVSIAASVLMLIPVVTVAINYVGTLCGNLSKLRYSPTLRFMFVAVLCYLLTSLQGVLSALRSVSEVTHFTHHTVAHAHLGLYGFFAMTMFGAVYYILPRVTQCTWPSASLVSAHFWGATIGLVLYVVPLAYGGILQGLAMNHPEIPFLKVVAGTVPYLQLRTLAGLILAAGHVAFLANIVWLFCRVLSPLQHPIKMFFTENTAAVGK